MICSKKRIKVIAIILSISAICGCVFFNANNIVYAGVTQEPAVVPPPPPKPAQPTPAPGASTNPAPGASTNPAPGASTEPSGGLQDKGKVQLFNPLTGQAGDPNVFGIVNNIIIALLGLTGTLALIAFVYGGVLWMVSFGDMGKVDKGKKMMIWAVIGLVVVFSSYAVLTLVFKAFGF